MNTPTKTYLIIITFFLIYFIFYACTLRIIKKVCLKSVCIQAELADSASKRQRGLMFRKNLAENKGMLFIFDAEKRHGFWMGNMRFPLDIIWIDHSKRIVDIYKDALPCKDICKNIVPQVDARFVLEVNSGFAEKNQVRIGDSVDF